MTTKTITMLEKIGDRLPEVGGAAGAVLSQFFETKLGIIIFSGLLATVGAIAGYIAKLALDMLFLKFKKRHHLPL